MISDGSAAPEDAGAGIDESLTGETADIDPEMCEGVNAPRLFIESGESKLP